jgi:ubiquinone/menaquinone biosynthesis C-methylase UbiE
MTADYEYRGLMAEAWDLLRGDYGAWPDRPFYRAIIERQGGPALDVGCGTGRLLLDYLAAGLDVDGVDNSPEMLAICRAKAAAIGVEVGGRLVEQPMDQLALARRYATIMIPSSSFQLLTDPSAAALAMARFHDHLAPAGLVVAPFMSKLWPGRRVPPQMQWSDWHMLAEKPRTEDGLIIRRWVRTRYDHEQQLEHEENRYEVLREGAVIQTEHHGRSPCVRWYSQAQAVECFERAGFAVETITRAFTFEPATPDDTMFCIIAKRS